MAKFNVTKVAPDGFMHHQGFDEVIDSVSWSLASLGHGVNVTQNWWSEQRETNIVFGAELMPDFQRCPPNTIFFNLEQPSHPNMATVRKVAKDSHAIVWDYSQRSVQEWKSAGHDRVVHVPIGYTENLTRIPHATPDIDVLFVGWLTARRRALIDELQKYGLNVCASAACYGGGRDQLISRAKVILNVHHDGRDRFEIVRVSYAMANGKCVVSESSSDDDEYADLRNGLSISPYRMLVESCRSYCSSTASQERLHMQDKAMELIKKRDFPAAIAAALDAFPPSTSASIPTPSRPLEFKMERGQHRREFMAEARGLAEKPHAKVKARYDAALRSGDMRDFVAWMREHARGNVMEIGVRDGASTSAFLLGVEEHGGHLYSVDVDPRCSLLFEGHPQWTFIHANSTDRKTVFAKIPYELDVLLIDGDHSKAGVLADLEYARLVRPGGMILFHDIAPEKVPDGCNDASWPGDDVRGVYEATCRGQATLGWTHEELPGRYGMGVLHRPVAAVAKEAASEDTVPVERR
jgi:predicted O-methyltransferase YrrM